MTGMLDLRNLLELINHRSDMVPLRSSKQSTNGIKRFFIMFFLGALSFSIAAILIVTLPGQLSMEKTTPFHDGQHQHSHHSGTLVSEPHSGIDSSGREDSCQCLGLLCIPRCSHLSEHESVTRFSHAQSGASPPQKPTCGFPAQASSLSHSPDN